MTQQVLTYEEIKFLEENTALTIETVSELSLSVHSLGKLSKVLDVLTERLQSPQPVITAAQFSKNYSFALIVPILYAMTVFNKGLNATGQNCEIQISENGGYHLRLQSLGAEKLNPDKRNDWRDNILRRLFKENISILHKGLTSLTKIPESILWENVASYIFWLYETRMQEKDCDGVFAIDDFRYIVMDAPGSIFGKEYNPFKNCFRFIEKEDKTIVRIRKTCCLTYKLPGSPVFCGDCRLNPINKQDPRCKTTHIF